MAEEENIEVIHCNMIEIFRSRLIKSIQVAPVLDHMYSLKAEFKEILRNTAKQSNTRAARLLINYLLEEPKEPNWFEEFVIALEESENSQAHLYLNGELPNSAQEAKQDYCEKLIRHLYPMLLEKMKPSELAVQCFKKHLCSIEDVENIIRCTNNQSQQEGNRELLSRITKKKDWFRTFVTTLHETENEHLVKELTGVTYEEFIVDCNEGSKSHYGATQCKRSPQNDEGVFDGNPDCENHNDCRRHELTYSEDSTLAADCNAASDPLVGAERSRMEPQDDKVASDAIIEESKDQNVTDDKRLLDSPLAGSSVISDKSTDRASPIPKMTLRAYQMEVAKPALEGENVIVCLPTGSGKTRVAVYITRHHLDKRRAEGLPAKAVVLVNKVPLVEQHFRSEFHPYLKDSYSVTKVSGDSQLKVSFSKEVKEKDVIICTAKILENELEKATKVKGAGVRLSDFSLLIIDECHHTHKDDVYNNIMVRYLKKKKRNEKIGKPDGPSKMDPLPQVLGLTASPGVGGANQREKAEEHILRICANLDSRIMTVKENIHYLQEQVKLPLKQVDKVEDKKKNPFGDELRKMMSKIEDFGVLSSTSEYGTQSYEQWVIQKEKSAAKEGNRTQLVCADHLRKYNDALQISDTIRMSDALSHLEKFYDGEKEKILSLPEIDQTDKFLINLFYNEKVNLRTLASNKEYENESLAKLRRAIMEEFSKNNKARGIVFTKTRHSAAALCHWISDNEKFKDVGIHAHFLIGAASNSDYISMTQKEQKKVIQKFKDGELNLLIATSVAEEGLDIPECNIVIMYGRIVNEIARMQARGRARATASKFIVVGLGLEAADHDSVNEYREEMMYEAIEKVQQMPPIEFAKKIQELQSQNIREKRVKKKKNMQKVYQENPHKVTFLCRKCHKLVFSGSDVRVIENMHHVISDPKFRKLFKKGAKTLPEKIGDCQINGEIICKACGRTWGTMMVHKGLDLPCIKISSFVIRYEEDKMTKDTLDFWSDLPIRFPAFEYVDPDISDDDEEDDDD